MTQRHRTNRTWSTSFAVLLVGYLGACGGGDNPSSPPTGAGVLSVVVAATDDASLELGYGTQATVKGRDSQGADVALGNRVVTWTSSNTAIATVTNGGSVNTVGVGTVTLSVQVQNGSSALTGTANLSVIANSDAVMSADVAMAPQQFVPGETVVKVGGTVRFLFTPIDHNVIWNPRKPGSPTDILVTTNATVLRSFPTVGVYPFDCTVHPGMSGRIIVSP